MIHDPRILAIDLRAQRFGYAVFEGPKRLLDWGVRAYPPGDADAAARRAADLLKLFHPSEVVVLKDRRTGVRKNSELAQVVNSIRHEAAIRYIPISFVTPEEIKESFCMFRVKTKHEIASMLVGVFPELLWKLPPKRRSWQSEHPRMAMFDAIAIGFTYWQRNGTRAPPLE